MASPRVLGGGEEGARRGPGERPGEGQEGGQEGVKNVYLSSKSVSKMRTLKQKVDVELKDACVGWEWMGVKNAYPSSESASKMRTLKQKVGFEASKTRTLREKVRQKCEPFVRKSAPQLAKIHRAAAKSGKTRIFGP